ncbi:MAG: M20/M25/M40 family metallo-hydrolase [Pseudonocardiaceae bacterium]
MNLEEKDDLKQTVSNLVDQQLWETLGDWVRFKSLNSDKTYPDVEPCRKAIIGEFKNAKFNNVPVEARELTINGITPLVYAECKSQQPNDPTVLLYAHYDVQPAKKEDGWDKDLEPFAPKDKPDGTDTRMYGRGAADDKSGIIMHLGTVKALEKSNLRVNLKLLFEGEEEFHSTLEKYLDDLSKITPRPPELDPFTADLIVIADTGNSARGVPTLTTTLRGYAAFDITVTTLESPVHSGMYGGPAPDAFMALVRLLATLHDDKGDVAVAGLIRDDDYPYAPMDETQFRSNAGVLPGVPLIGTGSLAQRLCARPAINVVGLDGVNSIGNAANVLCPTATARISVRLAPSQDLEKARKALEDHLTHLTNVDIRPWGIQVSVTPGSSGAGFRVHTTGEHFKTAFKALSEAYDLQTTTLAGVGGSIPLVNALQKVNPSADIVMWGCEEPKCRIHGTNESVSKDELKHMILAEAILLQKITPHNT